MRKTLTAVLLGAALLLTGCGDDRECAAGHYEEYTYMLPVYSGTVNGVPIYTYIPQVGTQFVCDEYYAEASDATG